MVVDVAMVQDDDEVFMAVERRERENVQLD
jgi:hypothetical protein